MRLSAKIALVFAVMALALPTAQADLIGHWTFDEASSGSGTGTALDSAGGYNGTLVGGAAYTTGYNGTGGALSLNGTGAYVNVGYHSALALAGSSYTIAWWENWGGPTGDGQRIINFDNGVDLKGGYAALYRWQNNGFGFSQSSNSDQNWFLQDTGPTQGVWEHIALTFDGTDRRLYINGVLCARSDNPYPTNGPVIDRAIVTPSNLVSKPDDLQFGAIPGYSQFFKGSLDDIRIYNNALSAGDVAALASVPEPSTLVLLSIAVASLLAYAWRKRQ